MTPEEVQARVAVVCTGHRLLPLPWRRVRMPHTGAVVYVVVAEVSDMLVLVPEAGGDARVVVPSVVLDVLT